MEREMVSQLSPMRNEAVSEGLGNVLLLSIVSALFTIVTFSVFHFLPINSTPSAHILCQVRGDEIILTHLGGDEYGTGLRQDQLSYVC